MEKTKEEISKDIDQLEGQRTTLQSQVDANGEIISQYSTWLASAKEIELAIDTSRKQALDYEPKNNVCGGVYSYYSQYAMNNKFILDVIEPLNALINDYTARNSKLQTQISDISGQVSSKETEYDKAKA